MAFSSKLTLSDKKVTQLTDDTLSLCGTTNVGIANYLEDKSSTYTERSIVDAGFVTGLTNTLTTNLNTLDSEVEGIAIDLGELTTVVSGISTDLGNLNTEVDDLTVDVNTLSGLTNNSICTASNGLTKDGRNVVLGGELTLGSFTCINIPVATGNPTKFNLGDGTCDPTAAFRGGKLYVGRSCTNADNIAYIGAKDQSGAGTTGSFIEATASAGLCSWFFNGTLTRTATLGANALVYGADYSSCFTPRSLVDKAYVTGQTSTINSNIAGLDARLDVIEPIYLTGATNGLTKVGGHDVKLGGNLTENTTITPVGATSITLGTTANRVLVSTGCTSIQNQTGSIVSSVLVNGTGSQLTSSDITTNGKFAQLSLCHATPLARTNVLNTTQAVTIEHEPNSYSIRGCASFPGFQYYADYKANYTDRSLVDKGFVGTVSGQTLTSAEDYIDNCVNACTITASNGLVKTLNNITLGGELTEETILNGSQLFGVNATTLNFTGATVNLGGAVAIKTTPSEGSGAILCRNATTGVIGLTSVTALGGITGATNGLNATGQNIHLGGALLNDTEITGAFDLSLGTDASKLVELNVNASGNATIVAGGLSISSCGGTFTDLSAIKEGLKYAGDYSDTFVDSSLVTKCYVDTIATGLQPHGAAWVATTENLDLNGVETIDGVETVDNMRVLVKNQTNAAENGIWLAKAGAWERAEDFNFSPVGEIMNGDMIPVMTGLTNMSTIWILTTPNPIESGDTLTFAQFTQLLGIVDGDGVNIVPSGSKQRIDVDLSANAGLCFNASDSNSLAINPAIAGDGLGWDAGVINVCAPTGGVASSVAVKRDGDDVLVVNTSEINTALGGVLSGTTNGLSEISAGVVELGGSLTKATTITLTSDVNSLTFTDSAATKRGIVYGGDYSASFGDNSLVSKKYVTGLTSTINSDISGLDERLDVIEPIYVTGATNGICKTDAHTVQLGGSITELTEINLVGNSYLRVYGPTGGTLNIGGPEAAPQLSYAGMSFNNGSGEYTGMKSDALMVQLTATSGSTQKIVQFCHNNGLVYYDDYSSDYTDRTLVDKAYVDNSTGSISADNGLTRSGDDIILGGALTGNTTIDLNLKNFSISDDTTYLTLANGEVNVSGSTIYLRGAKSALLISDSSYGTVFVDNGETPNKGIQYFDNYSGNFTDRTLVDKGYVDGCISAGAITAGQGLTNNFNTFDVCACGTPTGSELLIGFNPDDALVLGSAQISTDLLMAAGGAIGGLGNELTLHYNADNALVLPSSKITSDNLVASNGSVFTGTLLGLNFDGATNALGIDSDLIQSVMSANTYTNGLTNTDGVVTLGGLLTQNTTLCGGSTVEMFLGSLESALSTFAAVAVSDIALMMSDNTALVSMYSGNVSIDADECAVVTSADIRLKTESSASIRLTGSTVGLEGAVKLTTVPDAGTPLVDAVLVWNSTDKEIKQVSGAALGDKNNIYAKTVVTAASTTLTTGSSYLILVNYTNPSTITLPAAPIDGQVFKIKDASGDALTNNITIDGNGNMIDGSATALINTDFGAIEIGYDYSLDAWFSLAFIN